MSVLNELAILEVHQIWEEEHFLVIDFRGTLECFILRLEEFVE